jgi:hypothetical protein
LAIKRKKSGAGAVRRKPSPKPSKPPETPKEKTTEIVFSYGEIDFLRKITKKDFEGTSPKERKARLALRDKLLEINFNLPAAGTGGLIVLELGRGEVDFLQRITKEVYSFITAEERRARLILREKILIAVEKVTGKKILPDEISD